MPIADRIHPTPKAAKGSMRRAGSGRSAVRFMRASRSTSISWLNAADPNAAAAVPRSVCSSFIQSKDIPREARMNPKKVVMSTKMLSRTFISTTRSRRKLWGFGPELSASA